jgi:N6-L-threonylcarbamoyladenine synthase
MKILGIESSCDETAASVVEDGRRMLSNVVHSQIDIHAQYGGVVPEIAARSHIEVINPVINRALTDANLTWDDIDAIAVTYAPGLVGSLLVGTLAARTLAILKNKPLYPIHHVEAHVYANFLNEKAPEFPMLALIVSGGHTQLVLFRDHGDFELLGQTRDDAVGEAFDKVAKIIGLPYPGGPAIAKLAENGDPNAYKLPISKLDGRYDFSFSGLKTAVLRAVQHEIGVDVDFPSADLAERLDDVRRANFAASFQRTAVDTLVLTTMRAFQDYLPKSVVIAGGVSANQELRKALSKRLPIEIEYAPINLCTDNAAMIATLGYYYAQKNEPTDPYQLEVIPSLSMSKTAWAH